MDRKLPTRGQLERDLSQRFQKLYREELQHSPSKVVCKIFDDRLAFIIEDALTALEKTLSEDSRNEIAKQVNLAIKDVIKLKLKTVIEEVLAVEVSDILFNSSFKSQHAGAIVILAHSPQIRDRELIPRIKKSQPNQKDSEQSHFSKYPSDL